MRSSIVTRPSTASPAQVWSVLADGRRYSEWVDGTREIRDVEAGWPKPGSAIHFTAGIGPLTHVDKTTVLRSVENRQLELEIQAWPAGTVRVFIGIEAAGTGSMVTLDEHPLRGLAGVLHNPLLGVVFGLRTRLMIRTLCRLAEAEPA